MKKWKNILNSTLVVWVFLSAFYYVGNFIAGDLVADPSSNFYHKIFKYIVALVILLSFMLTYELWYLLLFYILSAIVLSSTLAMIYNGISVLGMIETLVVIISFAGFSYVGMILTRDTIKKIEISIILSAFIVSLISFYEYFYMWPVLGDYWRDTGGYRSVSTLLNPNNLGLYLGASIILIFITKEFSKIKKLIILSVICSSFIMTGSRTAWLSLYVIGSFAFLFNFGLNFSFRKLIIYMIVNSLLILMFFNVFVIGEVAMPERATDMYTAALRLEKYFSYLLNIDGTYLAPDFSGERIDRVSESSYFYYLNSLGIVAGFLYFLMAVSLLYLSIQTFSEEVYFSPFLVIFMYYMFAMLFENTLMSFPNNQLFFLVIGLSVTSYCKLNGQKVLENKLE